MISKEDVKQKLRGGGESVTELVGIIHPTESEQYSCDVGHCELIPEGGGYDILSDALAKFAGKRVKITIAEV